MRKPPGPYPLVGRHMRFYSEIVLSHVPRPAPMAPEAKYYCYGGIAQKQIDN
jgi:hypothetical protein